MKNVNILTLFSSYIFLGVYNSSQCVKCKCIKRCCGEGVKSYFGGSSVGFMLGSSCPRPAGLASASSDVTSSISISTLPCEERKQWEIDKTALRWENNGNVIKQGLYSETSYLDQPIEGEKNKAYM